MRKNTKLYFSFILSMIVTSCSGGATNPNIPSTSNLNINAKKPSASGEVEIKKVNLTGKVVDAITKKPIEGATVLVYTISDEKLLEKLRKEEVAPSPSPSAKPETSTAPASQPSPTITPSAKPIEEEEEKAVPAKNPVAKPTAKPSAKPTVKATAKPVVKASLKPVEKKEPTPKETPKPEPSTLEISPESLKSVLTGISINTLQEFETKTGNDGKYWLSKVPETNNTMVITVSAPNYKTSSVFSYDSNKTEDIYLIPISVEKNYSSVSGAVVSVTNKSVENAMVSSSYVLGESFTIPTNTNLSGDFSLDDVYLGERIFVASTKDENDKIISMGFLDTDIKKNDASYKTKKVSNPNDKKENTKLNEIYDKKDVNKEEKKEEKSETNKEVKEEVKEVKRDKDAPLIKLRAVTDYFKVKGKLDNKDKDISLKNVNVYIVFKKKGLPKEEIFFTEKYFTKSGEDFEVELPKLENIYQYHLEFVGVNKKGLRVYNHMYNVTKDTSDVKLSFLPFLSAGKVDFINKEGVKLPVFMWNKVDGASFYKITLEKQDKDNNITTVWEGITPFNTAIYPISTGSNKLSPSNLYSWTVTAVKEKDDSKSEKLSFNKFTSSLWTNIASSPIMEFSITSKDEEIEEIDKKKEG
ncbi:MAG: hypothetical protein U0457_07785 [Candidatus Sericytochromatia bacterium]